MQSKYILVITAIFVFFIMGCNGGGDSSKTEKSIEMPETPSVSQSMEIKTKVKDATVEVYWKFNENVKSYILDFGDKESGLNEHISLDRKTTHYKMSNLVEGETYLFRLVSIFYNGKLSTSKVIEAKIGKKDRLLQIDNGPKT
jgi:hypothetical protein